MDLAALAPALRAGFAGLRAALYPSLCWLCRERPGVDGFGCAEHAPLACAFDPCEPRCAGCAERLPQGLKAGPCARCRREGRGYARLVAFGAYREASALRAWILAFKHGGRRELARPLATLLALAWERAGGPPAGSVLTSVPLHPLRRLERGYDQAGLLAGELATLLGLEHVTALRRARWTSPQGEPGAASRRANVARAFVLRPRSAARLAGRPLWLVDDVLTSGATVRACGEVLRSARPAALSVLVLARAERPGPSPRGADEDADADPATLDGSRSA